MLKKIPSHGLCKTLWLAGILSLSAGVAPAQDADPPGRVARVDSIEGQASVQLAGAEDWSNDVVNRPLTTGDKVWIDNSSRADMHVGSIAFHLGDQTGVELLNVSDQVTQVRLSAGSANIRVRNLANEESVEVDTPNVSVALLQPGEYRLDVNDDGNVTQVAVISGQAEVSSAQHAYRIDPRQRGAFSGADSVAADIGDMNGPDALDLWAEQSDAKEDQAVSAQYVSRDVPGYEDLDDNGTWNDDPTYGEVWAPHVVAGWAPYHSGHWVWVSPWGWTWVDEAPWGFAPFHYGRWVNINSRWCWSPGRRGVRPVYAPALVAWVGGPNAGAGVAGGGVGWFPLGYNEVYRPAYRVSNAYIRKVNVTNTYIANTVVINNAGSGNVRYANQGVPGAVAAVPHDAFVSARPVGRNLMPVDQHAIAAAPASTASIAIPPTARSWARAPGESGRPVHAVAPAAGIFSRPTVSRRAPPPAPASVEAQRRAIIANGARPVAAQSAARPLQTRPSPVRIVSPNSQPTSITPAARLAVPQGRPAGVIDRPGPDRSARPAPNGGQPQMDQGQFQRQQLQRQEALQRQQQRVDPQQQQQQQQRVELQQRQQQQRVELQQREQQQRADIQQREQQRQSQDRPVPRAPPPRPAEPPRREPAPAAPRAPAPRQEQRSDARPR